MTESQSKGETMHSSRSKLIAIVAVLWLAISARAFAQSNPRYIRFADVPSAVKGALYAPDAPQKAPHVAILVIHRASNFMNTLACTELSQRGFLVLCMNPRSDNNEALVRWETIPLDVKAGVEFLKRQPGITKILLWVSAAAGRQQLFIRMSPRTASQCARGLKSSCNAAMNSQV